MKQPLKVATIEPVVPNYRYAFLQRLALRREIDTVCFHGNGRKGYSVKADERPLPISGKRIRNIFWPFGNSARIAYHTGTLAILIGRYDAIICIETTHNLTTWILLLLRPFGRYSVILRGHGLRRLHTTGWREPLRMSLRLLLARLADAMLVYSERGAAETIAAGIPAKKVFVAANTLDTERLTALARPPEKQDGAFVLLFVGRLYQNKRIDILIETVRNLRQRARSVQAVIVGDGGLRRDLEILAGETSEIAFEDAEYDDARLAAWFSKANLFVLPDAVGLAVIHSFANSVPVLTARNGRAHGPEFDYISDGENGLIADDLTAEAFADQVERLIDDPALADRLRAGALETARSVSIDAMADRYIEAVAYSRSTGRIRTT